MRVKEVSTEDFLEEKYRELQDVRATLSEFESRMAEIINNTDLSGEQKVLLIRKVYTRTLGDV